MNKKGFTLVEVTISIVLLSLVMIFMFKFLSVLKKDENNVTIDTEMIILRNSLSKYLNEDVRYNEGISSIKCCTNDTCSICGNLNYDSVVITLVSGKQKKLSYEKKSNEEGYQIIKYENITDGTIEFKEKLSKDYYFNPIEVIKDNNVFYLKAPIALYPDYDIELVYGGNVLDDKSQGSGGITLAKAILRDNPTISERTDFSSTNTENTTGTIYKTNKTEDSSYVYYYSGNTQNNWVNFGGYYWRIIRTNEDGSVRLLYSGTSHDTTAGYIGTSEFNSSSDSPMYAGYMYGTSASLENNRINTNDSEIKDYIDVWYKDNLLTNYDKYIRKSAIYCNDRSVSSGTYSISTSNSFFFGTYARLGTNKTPSYKCGANTSNGLFQSTQAVEDKFSSSTDGGGNGKLKYPIALMTADEISFAGGKWGTSLSSPYTWYYTNSIGSSITDASYWWLLSPYGWASSYSRVLYVRGSGYPGSLFNYNVGSIISIRPVVSLSSCVSVSGTGTPTDPYVVDETNSTC